MRAGTTLTDQMPETAGNSPASAPVATVAANPTTAPTRLDLVPQGAPLAQPTDVESGDATFDGSADLPVDQETGASPRATRTETAPPPAPKAAPPPVTQLGLQIARAAVGRLERLVVQLEPAELGRVEVRLEFGDDKRVSALIAVDRADTLEALQRDVRGLARSLEQAGLSLNEGGLEFSLRDGGSGQQQTGAQSWRAAAGRTPGPTSARNTELEPVRLVSTRLLDLHV